MMSFVPSPEKLFSLCTELVSIPSITGKVGSENEAALFIERWLRHVPYFEKNSGNIFIVPIKNDSLNRFCVAAFLEADPPCKETIIITGHFDVVDTKGFGPLESLAFRPQAYTERLKKELLPTKARLDYEKGYYLFGRGVADMKYGLALEMALIEEYSKFPEKLHANLLFVAVCDEENMSAGMRSVVPWLRDFQKRRKLDYLACINTEPSVGEVEERGSLYLGTVGKIMPFFLCVGREAHVGEYFKGISAPLIASCLTTLVEGDAESSDSWKGRSFPPMACLKLADLRRNYAVTVPDMAIAFFNSMVVQKTPSEILAYMKKKAKQALAQALALRAFSEKKLFPDAYLKSEGEPLVITFEELVEDVAKEKKCTSLQVITEMNASFSPRASEHERGIEIVHALLRASGKSGPLIVLGFLPPWYPPRCNRDEERGEKVLRKVAQELVDYSSSLSKEPIEIKEIFEGIMDLSYMGFQGESSDIEAVAANTPLWNVDYTFPTDDLKNLNVPVMNLGPIGKDAHQFTERLDLSYALHILPSLFVKAIERIPKLYRAFYD